MATKPASLRNGHAKAVYSVNGSAPDGDVTLEVTMTGQREMAVDVPPGYNGMASASLHQSRAAAASGSHRGTSPAAAAAAAGGAVATAAAAPQVQPEKLKKYTDEVKKNKEEEARLQRQQDFLRNSLRESKKLQALQQEPSTSAAAGAARRHQPQPPQQMAAQAAQQPVNANVYVNAAFSEEEDRGARNGAPLALKGKGTTVSGAQAVTPLKGLGLDQYFTLLQVLRGKLGGANSSELRFLSQLFNNTKFQDAVGLHNHLRDITASAPAPRAAVHSAAANDALDLCEVLPKQDTCKELTALLSQPAFKSLLMTHDVLAAVQMSPAAGGVGSLDEDEDVQQEKADEYKNSLVKVVRVSKSADPLGATVRNDGDAVVVGRIVKGGAVDLSGFLREGDELLEVNNVRIRGKNINEVSDMLANMTGQLVFIIAPSSHDTPPPAERPAERQIHIRALFDYDPEDDPYVPCQELGISFRKGDVLHVVSQHDGNWWQAYREGEEEQALAGLIPSKSFQEVMEGLRVRALSDARRLAEQQSSKGCCAVRRGKAARLEDAGAGEPEEILTYEEVERYYPQPNRKRPIVLIGPPDVGRKELREMLMQRGDGRFAAAVPHTSRHPRPDEKHGKDYHFVPKHLFEADIHANKFVEHGLFEGHYYGTSLEAIRKVYMGGETCVLNLHPTSIKMLRNSGLMPYVVFVAPPNIERLKQNIMQHSPPGKGGTVSAAQLKDIIDKGRDMEMKYGHYIDFIVTSLDYKRALDDLLAEINRIEVEPQWVPADWLTGQK